LKLKEVFKETVIAKGHPNIKALHKSTFEITKEKFLTPRGDCIIGVSANKSVKDFSNTFKKLVKKPGSIVLIILKAGNQTDIIEARGHEDLKLSSPTSIVVRKSGFIDNRTIAVYSNKAAADLNRSLINTLRKADTIIEATFKILLPS